MRKFLLFCLIGVLGTAGCTRDIPVQPAEELARQLSADFRDEWRQCHRCRRSASGYAPAYHFYGGGIGLWHGGICVQSTACSTANGVCNV